ncbi:MAG: DUF1800 domain-containing protein [Betaproteobacteria bacterium]|nr:DUF1800 domain-containing protein [Betaproteobacteria bacterium]
MSLTPSPLAARMGRILHRLAAAALLVCASSIAHAQTPALTGFWWKPTESGWGVAVQQQGAITFAVWFTYDAQSVPTWYTLQCTFSGTTCTGTLSTATGTPYPNISGPAGNTVTTAGTGTLTQTASNRLSLAYTVGNVTQTKTNLEPQNFVAADQVPVCTLQTPSGTNFRAPLTNYTDHWWGGASNSGWGLQISHQGNTVFFGWYTYGLNRNATWMTGQGTVDANNPRRITGTLYNVNPGIPFSQIAGPVNASSVQSVGTFELQFADGERGTFFYTVPAQGLTNRSLPLERFAVAGGQVNVCTGNNAVLAKAEASRLLARATFGPKMAEIDNAAQIGYSAWIDQQFAKPQTYHLPNVVAYLATLPADQQVGQNGFNWSIWKNFATADDQLRMRVAFALSEIFVISNNSNIAFSYPRGPAQYLDNLGTHAFGNFRNLIEMVTYSPMMGLYLSHLRNRKEDAATGSVPDENYAREVMQLFTIGLYELQPDGTLARDPVGRAIETYSNSDVSALARVFTGLSWGGPDTSDNRFLGRTIDPNREIIPMNAYNQYHSTAQKQFLGVTLPATTVATVNTNNEVRTALDRLFNHANAAPFFSKQLIQKLVTANPTPAYVGRVSAVFANNGSGVRGDMKAVIKAVLTDPEALQVRGGFDQFGKLREPVVRFVQWMRAFNARSADGKFLLGTTLDTSTQLAQSPMYSPSVFNFFRPGYIPGNSRVGALGLVNPEAQITNETTVAGYLNFMRGAIGNGVGTASGGVRDIQPDYSAEQALASNPDALVDRVVTLLNGTISDTTRTRIRDAVASVAATDTRNRVNMAVFLVMASPEYIFQN